MSNKFNFTDRDIVFKFVIDTFSMYYEAIDIVQVKQDNAMILSTRENDPCFNFCIHKDGSLDECIKSSIPIFQTYKRMPLILVTPASSYYGQEIQMEKVMNDSFMFLENKDILQNFSVADDVQVELCTDDDVFIKTWANAWSDPNDVYGAASEVMINGMRRFFEQPPTGFNHFATMAFKNGVPAGTVVSVYNKDFLLVIGLGTLSEYRKMGIGTALMKDIMERAEKLGIKAITLQTESGTYNERYYEKIGFETKFNGIYYKVKNE